MWADIPEKEQENEYDQRLTHDEKFNVAEGQCVWTGEVGGIDKESPGVSG